MFLVTEILWLIWWRITMRSYNIIYYTLPVLAQAMYNSCYPDDLAQPGNLDNSHYGTMQETGSLVLRLLMRPLTNGAKRSGVAEWGAEAPDWLSTAESHNGWCWHFTLLFFSHIRELYDNHQVISNMVLKGTVGKLLTCRLQICNKIFLPPQIGHCVKIFFR